MEEDRLMKKTKKELVEIINKIDTKHRNLSIEHDTMKINYHNSKVKCEALNKAVDVYKKDIDELNEKFKNDATTIERLKVNNNAIKETLDKANQYIDKLKSENIAYKEQLVGLNKHIDVYKKDINRLSERIKSDANLIEKLKSDTSVNDYTIKMQKKLIDENKETLDKANQYINNLKEKIVNVDNSHLEAIDKQNKLIVAQKNEIDNLRKANKKIQSNFAFSIVCLLLLLTIFLLKLHLQ